MKLIPIKGAEHIKRGANERWHTGNISKTPSRGFNPVEQGVTRKLEADLEAALEKVFKRHAQKFLKQFRKLVAAYKTHNHKIEIVASMGYCIVTVNGALLQDKPQRGMYVLLAEIEQAMNWEWGAYLDGERLN